MELPPQKDPKASRMGSFCPYNKRYSGHNNRVRPHNKYHAAPAIFPFEKSHRFASDAELLK